MSGRKTDAEEFARALERRVSEPKWKRGDYCYRCQNTGEVNCYCGGDMCVCGEQEIECPECHGESAYNGSGGFDGDDD